MLDNESSDEVNNPLDELNNPRRGRGRPKKSSENGPGHIIYVSNEIWDAAGQIPGKSRQDIAREAYVNYISYYRSDLPRLRWQLEELRDQIKEAQAKEAALVSIIAEREAQEAAKLGEQQEVQAMTDLAIAETVAMCKAHKRNTGFRMGYEQYHKLEKLSGIDAAKIEVFLTDAKFRPDQEALRIFYNG